MNSIKYTQNSQLFLDAAVFSDQDIQNISSPFQGYYENAEIKTIRQDMADVLIAGPDWSYVNFELSPHPEQRAMAQKYVDGKDEVLKTLYKNILTSPDVIVINANKNGYKQLIKFIKDIEKNLTPNAEVQIPTSWSNPFCTWSCPYFKQLSPGFNEKYPDEPEQFVSTNSVARNFLRKNITFYYAEYEDYIFNIFYKKLTYDLYFYFNQKLIEGVIYLFEHQLNINKWAYACEPSKEYIQKNGWPYGELTPRIVSNLDYISSKTLVLTTDHTEIEEGYINFEYDIKTPETMILNGNQNGYRYLINKVVGFKNSQDSSQSKKLNAARSDLSRSRPGFSVVQNVEIIYLSDNPRERVFYLELGKDLTTLNIIINPEGLNQLLRILFQQLYDVLPENISKEEKKQNEVKESIPNRQKVSTKIRLEFPYLSVLHNRSQGLTPYNSKLPIKNQIEVTYLQIQGGWQRSLER